MSGAVPAAYPAGYRDRYLGAALPADLGSRRGRAGEVVVLPTGAIEQHGPHLPVGVDAILGQVWVTEVLARLAPGVRRRVWVAPAVTYGKSNEHVGFAGTVWVGAVTLRRLVRAAAVQVSRWGFRKLAILNTHGGNSAVLVATVRELEHELGVRTVLLGSAFDWPVDAQERAYGFHAGEIETSLMLARAGATVRPAAAPAEFPARLEDPGLLRPENAPATFSWISADISRTGVMGDARAATREKGEAWVPAVAEGFARQLAAFVSERPAARVAKPARRRRTT